MREIKFRAWDTQSKIMSIEVDLFHGLEDWEYGRVEIMQYTGLTDKNGLTEIYESDKIRFRENYYIVTWVGAGFWLVGNDLSDVEINFNSAKEMEVTGNIWEDQLEAKTKNINE